MAGRADRLATGILSASLLVTAGGTLGCTGRSKEPRPLPPVTEMPKTPEEPPRPSEPPIANPTPPTMVVIDEGGDKDGPPPTLAQAAQAEKERRASATKPVVRLDNKSLVEHGKDQKLTVAQGQAAKAPAEPDAATASDLELRDENYWRERGLEIRKRWREAADRQEDLQTQANGLRQRFYAADDPYLRDGRIKPEWDRVLNELDLSRREAEACATELETFLDEGRQAGALPGWLREGAELEPEVKPLKAPSAEPREPVESSEPPGDPS